MTRLVITLVLLAMGIIGVIVSSQNLVRTNEESNTAIKAINQDLDASQTQLISDCSTKFTNPVVLQQCVTDLTNIKQKCTTDSSYSSFASCNDPRLEQFLMTANSKILNVQTKISTDVYKILDACSSIYAPLESCKASMLQIQANCENTYVPACDDVRITQILNKQPVQPSQPTGDMVSQSNQQVSDYLGMCLTATQTSDIQSCADTANKMINLCNSMQGGIPSECSDPRLQQVANMGQPITTSSSESPLQPTNGFLKMDRTQYSANTNPPEFATISGKVNDPNGGYVILTITYPYGGTDQLNAYVTETGAFSSPIILDKSYPPGTYTVSGNYHDLDIGSVSFVVK